MTPTVCIDPGHGGDDDGAVANGVCEAAYVHRFSRSLAVRMVCMWPAMPVVRTRTEPDVTLTLVERAGIASAAHAGLAISVHCNAGPEGMHGGQAYVLSGDHVAYGAALRMLNAWPIASMGRPVQTEPNGWKRRAHNVLSPHEGQRAAVLIELGHLTSPDDVAALHARWVREQMICAIMLGVAYWADAIAGASDGDGSDAG